MATVFLEFDEDDSNSIDFLEFRKLVCRLLGVEQPKEISEVTLTLAACSFSDGPTDISKCCGADFQKCFQRHS